MQQRSEMIKLKYKIFEKTFIENKLLIFLDEMR